MPESKPSRPAVVETDTDFAKSLKCQLFLAVIFKAIPKNILKHILEHIHKAILKQILKQILKSYT